MKDRVPRYPGRVQLTPVPGQANTYDLVRADDPAEAGTPLNKASLLQDNTATALGLSGDPTVNDALARLSWGTLPANYFGGVVLRVLDPQNRPVPGMSFTGLSTFAGSDRATNSNGELVLLFPEDTSLSVRPVQLIGYTQPAAQTIRPAEGDFNIYTYRYTGTGARVGDVFTFTTSTTIVFPIAIARVDVFLLAAGGSGGRGMSEGGGGGGGGEARNLMNLAVMPRPYALLVGAGGPSSGGGTDGGGTVFDTTTVNGGQKGSDGNSSTGGGNGGSGGGGGASNGAGGNGGINGANGNAGAGSSGNPGGIGSGVVARKFNLSANPMLGNGGGGGAYGTPGGTAGTGAGAGGATNMAGASAIDEQGGGGGGGGRVNSGSVYGGDGGNGIIEIRIAAIAA